MFWLSDEAEPSVPMPTVTPWRMYSRTATIRLFDASPRIRSRLPYGMGVARLTDLPAEWSRQREMLGFPSH
jgi:hypothetical protein